MVRRRSVPSRTGGGGSPAEPEECADCHIPAACDTVAQRCKSGRMLRHTRSQKSHRPPTFRRGSTILPWWARTIQPKRRGSASARAAYVVPMHWFCRSPAVCSPVPGRRPDPLFPEPWRSPPSGIRTRPFSQVFVPFFVSVKNQVKRICQRPLLFADCVRIADHSRTGRENGRFVCRFCSSVHLQKRFLPQDVKVFGLYA